MNQIYSQRSKVKGKNIGKLCEELNVDSVYFLEKEELFSIIGKILIENAITIKKTTKKKPERAFFVV